MGHLGTTPDAVQRSGFAELSTQDLYDILRLRSAVFVVEQDCVFLDLDGRDHEARAEHLWLRDEVGIAATLRLLHEGGTTWSIGRVTTRPDVRSRGVAAQLLRAGLDRLRELGASRAEIGAQAHLRDWYGRFGFAPAGPRYLEDGILHLPMALALEDGP